MLLASLYTGMTTEIFGLEADMASNYTRRLSDYQANDSVKNQVY